MSADRRPTVVLVGPPGAGKTTVGRMLARRLGVEFTDVDETIVAGAGKSISDLFLQDGEDAFRALERVAVTDALAATDGVLALGGGAVLAESTRERLRGHRVVLLTVGLADGLRRTGMSTARPLLAGVNPRAAFKALLDARLPLYREVATVEVDTVRRSTRQVTRAVLVAIGELAPDAAEDPPDEADEADALAARPSGPDGATLLPTPTIRARDEDQPR